MEHRHTCVLHVSACCCLTSADVTSDALELHGEQFECSDSSLGDGLLEGGEGVESAARTPQTQTTKVSHLTDFGHTYTGTTGATSRCEQMSDARCAAACAVGVAPVADA